jgi:phthalate 4,5-dioxygenase
MERGESFSGIKGVQIEDSVVQESMGALYDRTLEHLGASDIAVIRMRRLMLEAARNLGAEGKAPFAVDSRTDYSDIQPLERIIPLVDDWKVLRYSDQSKEIAR